MNITEREYLYSKPLDVHRWSEYPESNIFVEEIYNNDEFNHGKRKRSLPIVESFNLYLIYKWVRQLLCKII